MEGVTIVSERQLTYKDANPAFIAVHLGVIYTSTSTVGAIYHAAQSKSAGATEYAAMILYSHLVRSIHQQWAELLIPFSNHSDIDHSAMSDAKLRQMPA